MRSTIQTTAVLVIGAALGALAMVPLIGDEPAAPSREIVEISFEMPRCPPAGDLNATGGSVTLAAHHHRGRSSGAALLCRYLSQT